MSVVTAESRDRLHGINDKLVELRKRRTRAEDLKNACRSAIPEGPVNTASDEFQRLQRATSDLDEIRKSIALVEQEQSFVLSQLAGLEGSLQRESFLNDPDTMNDLRLLATSSLPIGDRLLGPAVGRDELLAEWDQRRRMAAAGDVTLPSDTPRTQFYGIIPALRRELRLLDLIPSSPCETGQFDILREAGTYGAAETNELAVKPSGGMSLTEFTVKIVTIAEWYRIARQSLADVPALGTTINSRLRWSVEARLESQILNGDGVGANMTGILNTSGIGAPASGSGDSVNADMVMNAISTVRVSNATPDAIVMNPGDVAKAVKVKSTGSGERLDSSGAFGMQPTSMWGLPLVQTTAMTAGTALVGAFAQGSMLWAREGFLIRISDSDQSDFLVNALKVLGELRAGFAVMQPTAFAKVTLSFAN